MSTPRFLCFQICLPGHEELYDPYSSTNIIRVIKSGRVTCAGHVACMGDRRGVYRILEENLRERNHVEDLGVDGRIISKWSSRSGIRRLGLDCFSSGYRRVVDACECGNEPSGSKNEGNFLTCWGTVSFAGRTVLQGVSKPVSWLVTQMVGLLWQGMCPSQGL